MEKILTNKTVSLTEMRDPAKVLANAGDTPVAVLNRNKVVGYFVPNGAVNQIELEYADHGEVQKTADDSIERNQHILDYLQDK
jgi:antitoxin StbD